MPNASNGVEIELISFGNELLIGEIVNTNANWLAKELTLMGTKVTRITTGSDDLHDLESVFTECFSRKPQIIISTGGLGPTWDDRTLEGLGKAVREEIKKNDEAFNYIKAKYAEFNIEMSKQAEKMGMFPVNGKALLNPVGTAPGCYYHYKDKTHIFILPGVPKEMKGMFEQHVKPFIQERFTESTFYQQKFEVMNSYESKIAAVTSKFTKEYPEIYIKSHPNQPGLILMHITAYGDEKTQKLLNEVVTKLKSEIKQLGGTIREVKVE